MPFDSLVSRSDVSALIPEDVAREIWKNMPKSSAALSLFPQRRLSRAQQRVPVLSVLPTAYFVAGDTGLKQTTEQQWANKFFNVEEIAVIVPIPEAVLADADYDIWGEIRPNIEEAIGRVLDAAIFFGTNKPASWPDAIATQAIAAGNVAVRGASTAAQGGIAGDLSNLFATIEADGYDVNGIIANRIYRGLLRQVRDTTGQKIAEVVHQVNTDSAFGVPINYPMRGMWPTGASAVEAIAGDFQFGQIGIRQDMTFKLITEGVISDDTGAILINLPQQDSVAMRVVFRVAWQLKNPINYDQPTEANRNPFGVMRAPA